MAILEEVINSIKSINTPRYYKSERGYQTEFYSHLSINIKGKGLFPEQAILEAEVQKRTLEHYGITQRPDLLIHIPIETGLTEETNENNFLNIAFKLKGNKKSSIEDFMKLDEMFEKLNYKEGLYINIGKFPTVFLEAYEGNFKNRIHEFSIGLVNGEVRINHAYFNEEEIIVEAK